MKLLLTSAGLSNNSIILELKTLLEKEFTNSKVVFIPTASNFEMGDKSWLIKDLIKLTELGFKEIEIADISAISKEVFMQKMENVDVIFVEGGNTFGLMREILKKDLKEIIQVILKKAVYLGVSAGTIITNPILIAKNSQDIYGEDSTESSDIEGLNFVNFYTEVHMNSVYFPESTEDNARKVFENFKEKVYFLDDNSAISVNNGMVKIVSEGKFLEFN